MFLKKLDIIIFACVCLISLLQVNAQQCISYKDLKFNPLLIAESINTLNISDIKSCYSDNDVNSRYENNLLSSIYYFHHNHDSSRIFLQRTINTCISHQIEGDQLALPYYLLSNYYQLKGHFDLAIIQLEYAQSIASSKQLLAALEASKIRLLGRDEINNDFNSLSSCMVNKEAFGIEAWYSILCHIGTSSLLYRKDFFKVLNDLEKIENPYLKVLFIIESTSHNLRELSPDEITKYQNLVSKAHNEYGFHNDRLNALSIKHDVSIKIATGKYIEANESAKRLIDFYNIDTSDVFNSITKYNQRPIVSALKLYSRSLLYLTRAGKGLPPVKKAYNIYLDLIRFFNREPRNFNNAHYLLSINYYGLDNVLVIASYLSQKTGDISYLTRAHSALDALKSRTVRADHYANQYIKAGGKLGKMFTENKTLARELFLKKEYALDHSEEKLFDELSKSYQDRIDIGEAISKALTNEKPIFAETDITNTVQRIQQDILTDSSCLILFHTGDHHHSMLVRKDTILHSNLLHKLPSLAAYTDFGALVSKKTAPDTLAKKSKEVYQALFGDYAPFLKKRLFIIANGPFETFPFAALRQDTTNQACYFGSQHILSYHYSLRTFIEEQQENTNSKANEAILALAPTFNSTVQYVSRSRSVDLEQLNLSPLLYNRLELEALKEKFPGSFHGEESAQKSIFLQEVADYGIIHLATHAIANPDLGERSAFFLNSDVSNAKVAVCQAGEVATLNLDADLVVLSACETGLGSRLSSEGTVGLTRAFSSAGAKSLLSTLWSVDDRTTSEIVIDFYDQLKQGKSKSVALSTAQSNYRQRYAGTEKAHPYYWASFILVGNDAPIEWLGNSNSNFSYWIFAGLFLISIISLFMLKRKSN